MSVKNTLEFFKISKPTPTAKDIMTQFGADIEECTELFEAFGFGSDGAVIMTLSDTSLWAYAARPTEVEDINRKEALDAICDKLVTVVGLGYMLGMNVEGAFKEVPASNLSKFIKVSGELTPAQLSQFAQDANDIEAQGRYTNVTWKRIEDYVVYFDGNGKILKSPRTFFGPDLTPYIGE